MRYLFFYGVTKCKVVVSYSSLGPRQRYFLLFPPPEYIFTFSALHPTSATPLLTKQPSSSLQLSPQPHRTHMPTMLLIPQFSCFSFSLLYLLLLFLFLLYFIGLFLLPFCICWWPHIPRATFLHSTSSPILITCFISFSPFQALHAPLSLLASVTFSKN